jgi:hypothetical protein
MRRGSEVSQSIIKPLRPSGPPWVQLPPLPSKFTLGFEHEVWMNTSLVLGVISAVEVAQDKDGIDRGPEYHISISKNDREKPRRCTSDEAAYVLRAFDLEGAEEDNHVPHGVVRNFWRTVAQPLIGLECACKADEPAIREDKGDYVWRP